MEKLIKLELTEIEFENVCFDYKTARLYDDKPRTDEEWSKVDKMTLPKYLRRQNSIPNNGNEEKVFDISQEELLRYLRLQCDTHDDIFEVFQLYHDLPDRNILEKMFGKLSRCGDHFVNLCNWGLQNFDLDVLPGNLLLLALTQENRFKHDFTNSDIIDSLRYRLDEN